MLPLMIGGKVPEEDKVWQLLMTLKDTVEPDSNPYKCIGYLDSKIGEHQYRFFEVFSQENLIPKHHFLEHYPWLITEFGPLGLYGL